MNQQILRWIKIVVLRVLREKNLTRLDTGVLISAGMLGYSQALKRFDPGRNVKFKTYAEHRIKGAVLDEVRKMIGDERCKNPRPRRVDGYDYTLISDDGRTQAHMESQLDLESFILRVPLTGRELDILKCRMAGRSLREISKEFEFSESRASQLLAKIKQTVYVFYKDQLGFKLVNYRCPLCQNENCVAHNYTEFRCDICDHPLQIVNGVPIAAVDEDHQQEAEHEIRFRSAL